ncbi:MAG: hypothetical protein B7Y02_17770, partial [Rhodobacterales bacterium 17-64-5]
RIALGLAVALAAWGGPVLAGTAPKEAKADSATPLPDSAGSYLAARAAMAGHQFVEAARWYAVALQVTPQNPDLLQGALTAALAQGDVAGATRLARALAATGAKSQIASMTLVADDAIRGDFAAILKDQAGGATLGQLMDDLVTAWAEVGTGKMSDASGSFDKIIGTPGMAAFGLYHKALALAQTGDFEGAEKLLSQPGADPINGLRRGVLAKVEILSQLDRGPEAVALIDKVYGPVLDDGLADLRRRLAAGEPLPFDVARTPQEGLAEAFFTLATVLADQADDTYTLLNTRIASALRPDHVEADLMSARVLEKLGQFDLAMAAFAKVPEADPAYVSAMVGQASSAMSAGKLDESVALLKALADKKPDNPGVLTAYGDSLRRQGHCDTAVLAYTQ